MLLGVNLCLPDSLQYLTADLSVDIAGVLYIAVSAEFSTKELLTDRTPLTQFAVAISLPILALDNLKETCCASLLEYKSTDIVFEG